MKLSVIAKRGIQRDFWDLHEIVVTSPIDLNRAFDSYVEKFGVSQADLYHVMRSLTYFDDADKEHVFPAGLTLEHWEQIKNFSPHGPRYGSSRNSPAPLKRHPMRVPWGKRGRLCARRPEIPR
jgi:hypothetical protein